MSANIISVDEGPLDALLDEEASGLVRAERYKRTAGRENYHSGRYARRLVTGAGEVDLSVPKLFGAAARTVRDGFAETLAYTEFPPEHWRRIRTNNGIERINREIRRRRRRTRVVGTCPVGNSTLMLVTVRLKYTAEHEWGKRRYLDMSKLEEMDELEGKTED